MDNINWTSSIHCNDNIGYKGWIEGLYRRIVKDKAKFCLHRVTTSGWTDDAWLLLLFVFVTYRLATREEPVCADQTGYLLRQPTQSITHVKNGYRQYKNFCLNRDFGLLLFLRHHFLWSLPSNLSQKSNDRCWIYSDSKKVFQQRNFHTN